MIRVIKSEVEYRATLDAVSALVARDPTPGTSDAERLELLSLLIEDYEDRVAPRELPEPIEAIRFRMEQAGLRQRDLVPFIGSASKVSEVLSGKRPLTLTMIRALHEGLGIPAHVLIRESTAEDSVSDATPAIEWARFPLKEMVRRGWVDGVTASTDLKAHGEAIVRRFFEPVGQPDSLAVLFRRGIQVRSARKMDRYALMAWTARVMTRVVLDPPEAPYVPGSITPEFMTEVARLSWSDQGPRLAVEFLDRHGIPVVVEPHLPGTHLDGAAVLLKTGRPAIGITVRQDRLDNFWFCLMHELAHVGLHLTPERVVDGPRQFYDDLEAEAGGDGRESEADAAADEALIPETTWRDSPASKLRAAVAVKHLATRLRIHPAIVAGRIRFRSRDYRVLTELVGQGQVRQLFPETRWYL
jgi:HTH-type transcriptional regulator / antitoxin HigA